MSGGYTDRGRDRGDYPRVCDGCGHRWMFKQLVYKGELRWECPDCAPGLTATQISRHNARAKPLIVRPRKHAKDYVQTPIYQLAEAQIFNFVAATAPASVPGGSNIVQDAAWAAIYMADIIIQGLRPAIWTRKAESVMDASLAYLLTQQYGAPTGITPSGTPDNPRYGGIAIGSGWSPIGAWFAGLAFVKGYNATGNTAYLDAADRCATFLRHAQCVDVQASAWTVFPSGGGPYHVGGIAASLSDATGLFSGSFTTREIGALWFLKALADVRGSDAEYGDEAATAFFTSPTVASLSTMMSELLAFAETGAKTASGYVTGWSASTPSTTYSSYTSDGGGTGSWGSPTTITTSHTCFATTGVFMASGLTASVQAILDWLASFSANSANEIADGTLASVALAGIKGTYDPALAPATSLTTSAPLTEAADALYDWASFGILSPILSSVSPAAFRTSKDTLSTAVRYAYEDVTLRYIGPLGRSGLNLQPRTSASASTPTVQLAAQTGLAYRQLPGRYPSLRGN